MKFRSPVKMFLILEFGTITFSLWLLQVDKQSGPDFLSGLLHFVPLFITGVVYILNLTLLVKLLLLQKNNKGDTVSLLLSVFALILPFLMWKLFASIVS